MSIVEAKRKAHEECTEQRDIYPAKKLRPIGDTFRTWNGCENSTDEAHWVWWKVKGYMESFRGRSGNILMYERMEEIEGIDPPEN